MLDGIQAQEIYSDEICYIFRYSLASSDCTHPDICTHTHTPAHLFIEQ